VQIDWEVFREWLSKNHTPQVTKSIVSYATKYSDCLISRDLSRVRDIKQTVRPNIVKALAALSKFLGIHEEYKKLVRAYGISWKGRSSDDLLIDRLNRVENPNEVFEWVKKVKAERPALSDFMDFIVITGLRLSEAVSSYNLIIKLSKEGKLGEYYNAATGSLEHYKFKDIFIRRSKKAFVSFISEDQVKRIGAKNSPITRNLIEKFLKRRCLKLKFSDVREAHATLLTRWLQPVEIDFLHGRVSATVFLRHYFNPKLLVDLQSRALQGIQEIMQKIS
jgi:intergrase/recombinase